MTAALHTPDLRGRISRRRALAGGAALAGGLAATAAGCGGSETPGGPRSGGVLHTGTSLPLSTGLDPQTEVATGLAIFPRVYGYLLHIDPDGDDAVLDHAESVEQPDEATLVFRLRPDLRFHNVPPAFGRSVTAEDIAASIRRYRDNPLVSSKLWHTVVLDSVEAVDDRTLLVRTRRPYAYSLNEIGAIGAGAILPREISEGAGIDISASGAGSGPFVTASVDNAGETRLVRNPTYYRAPVPYLDAMTWQVFEDDATKVQAFRDRLVDVAPARDRPEADTLRTIDGAEVTREPSLACISFGMRLDAPPFADPRVREAIDLGLDRGALVGDVTFGEGDVLGPVNQHMAGGYWSLTRDEVVASSGGSAPAAERLTRARAMLEQAGALGAAFEVQAADAPQVLDVATVLVGQLRALGFAATLRARSLLDWFVSLRRGAFTATVIAQQPHEWPDQPTRYYHSAGPDGAGSPFGFADGEIDALVERSWGELDRERRRATLLAAQPLMLRARPMLQIFTSAGYTSAWGYVRNRRPELRGSQAQYNYEQWIDAKAAVRAKS